MNFINGVYCTCDGRIVSHVVMASGVIVVVIRYCGTCIFWGRGLVGVISRLGVVSPRAKWVFCGSTIGPFHFGVLRRSFGIEAIRIYATMAIVDMGICGFRVKATFWVFFWGFSL